MTKNKPKDTPYTPKCTTCESTHPYLCTHCAVLHQGKLLESYGPNDSRRWWWW